MCVCACLCMCFMFLYVCLSLCVCVCVFQVSAWGGYVFIINLIPLHVFVLMLMQRYSKRVYIGESTHTHKRLAQPSLW